MTITLTIGGNGFSGLPGSSFSSSSTSFRLKNSRTKIICSSSSAMDPYKTLQIRPGASEYEVKKAFRQLAKKYHPDVCRGSNCGVQFQTINEAYDIVLNKIKNQLSGIEKFEQFKVYEDDEDEYEDEDQWMGGYEGGWNPRSNYT